MVNPDGARLSAIKAWHDQCLGLVFELIPEQLFSNPRPHLAALLRVHTFLRLLFFVLFHD